MGAAQTQQRPRVGQRHRSGYALDGGNPKVEAGPSLLATAALAADISGAWSGNITMGDNQFTLSYTFKQDGEKLTGTVVGPQGDPLPLVEGKVEGDKVSFAVKVDMNGSPAKFVSSGTIKGEEIAITTKVESGDFPPSSMTLKRTK